ncbi:LysR family transcriptional regulator [Spirochaetia bacterium]|nr:LysR family transcriptional regulator [Spirochaetia bacterium]
MELLQLRHFRTVAKMENITNAAESLNISQPSLSKTIINLELELGASLFDRLGRHIYLNTRGKLFYEKICDALDILDGAKNLIDESTESSQGEVSLLILAASRIMPELIKDFMKKYPQIRLNLHQQTHYDLRYSEEYDFSISATPMDYSRLETIPLLTEEIVLGVASSHPLAGRGSIDLREAADCDFVTFSQGPSLRVLSDSLCYMAGFTPKIRCECDGVSALFTLISEGLGVALLPVETLVKGFKWDIVSLPLKNLPAKRTINLSWRSEKYMSKACTLFKQSCVSFFREHVSRPGPQFIGYNQ